MLNWGITLLVIGLFSFVLPMFGRQFLIVTAFSPSGLGTSIAGFIISSVGACLVYLGIKKEQKKLMKSEENSLMPQHLLQEPTFEVEDASIMSKSVFSPREFGMEITNLSFAFSVEQFDKHVFNGQYLSAGFPQAPLIKKNPEAFQVFLALLFIGAALCYIQVILRADEKVLEAVARGISDGLKGKIPSWNNSQIEIHQCIAINFSIALRQEISETDLTSSIKLFLQYLTTTYPDAADFSSAPGLISYLNGLGTRFMAVYQNIFKVRLARA